MCGFIFTIDVGTASRRLNIFGKTWVELIYAVWVSIPGQKLKYYEGGEGGLILGDGPLAQYSEQGKTRNPPTDPSHRRSPRENTPEWYFTYKWPKIFLKIFENYVWVIEDTPLAEKIFFLQIGWVVLPLTLFRHLCDWNWPRILKQDISGPFCWKPFESGWWWWKNFWHGTVSQLWCVNRVTQHS